MRLKFPKANSRLVALALEGHTVIGVSFAAVIYILSLSGVLSVFNHELQRWEQPNAPEMASIGPDALQGAAETLLSSETQTTTHFYVQLPVWDLPRTVLTTDTQAVFIDEEGRVTGIENHPWTQFILDLHYYLTLPGTLGLTVVGLTGVILLSLTVTGLLGHPRVFRDAFRFRFNGNKRLTEADIHNRLAVWSSPFIISSALTGAMLGLAGIISGVIANLDYEGDIPAVYAPVFGDEPPEIETTAPLANISAALSDVQTRFPQTDPVYVLMHEPNTAGQHLQILSEHPERLIFGDYYNYSSNGEYQRNVGMSDGEIGQQVAASVYRLHFGSFGGMPIKFAYALFGVALAAIICAGLNIFFIRRRERGLVTERLEASWSAIVWGVPTALALTLVISVSGLASFISLSSIFWLTLLFFVVGAAVIGEAKRVSIIGLGTTSATLFLAIAVYGTRYFGDASSNAFWGVTTAFVLLALCFVVVFSARIMKPNQFQQSQSPTPAE
ncbi:MAG: PepSY-associated TM helix domain-containing protein [Pseudomonadota bacterium]